MTTMMEHPKHGRHPAIGHEIEPMKANGWTVCAPKGLAPQSPGDEQIATLPAPVRRRGPNKAK